MTLPASANKGHKQQQLNGIRTTSRAGIATKHTQIAQKGNLDTDKSETGTASDQEQVIELSPNTRGESIAINSQEAETRNCIMGASTYITLLS